MQLHSASDKALDQVLALSTAPIVLSHTSADAVHDHARNIDDERLRALAAKGGVIHVNALGAYWIPTPKIAEREAALEVLSKRLGAHSTLTRDEIQQWLLERAEIDDRYPIPVATLDDYMRHLLHILEVVGTKHVGIGADWDGGGGVSGLEDVSMLPRITERLLMAGYSAQDVENIWGGNLLRVIEAAQAGATATP